MENKLEQLLNSLIEKGWKPRGRDTRDIDEIQIERLDRMGCYQNMDYISFMRFDDRQQEWFVKYGCSIVDLVSKWSWLWQFVCENGMIKKEWNSEWTIIYPNERTGDYQKCHSYCKWQSEYWILESSLKDESELEKFLLSNIVIKDE